MSQPKTTIYTDGACSGNPGPGGWAAILIKPDRTVIEIGGSQPHTTNNRMEMLATIEAIKRCETNELELCTDSKYVIQGVTQWAAGWEKKGWRTAAGKPVANLELWQELLPLCKVKKVKWTYVPGHSGHIGNDRADAIAVGFSLNQNPGLFEGAFDHSPVSGLLIHFS